MISKEKESQIQSHKELKQNLKSSSLVDSQTKIKQTKSESLCVKDNKSINLGNSFVKE